MKHSLERCIIDKKNLPNIQANEKDLPLLLITNIVTKKGKNESTVVTILQPFVKQYKKN